MGVDQQEYAERYGTTRRAGSSSPSVKTNQDAVFAGLDKFTKKIKETGVYVASQAAAEVFYREAKLNCPTSDKGHWFHGTQFKVNGKKYWFEAGTLRDSIYQVNSKDNSGDGRATYHVSWNKDNKDGCPYGFMVEFGTSRAAGVGFMRRAYTNAMTDANTAASVAMDEFIARQV